MAVLSLPQYITVDTSCIEYVHPWTDSCRDASLGLLFHAFPYSLKTYITVYLFTMIMRYKKPTKDKIENLIKGILQSTVFLSTHACGFSTIVCGLRHLTGRFDKLSVSFLPAFISSLVAIQLERPSRRPILCLYVCNEATETLFRMAVWRGWIKPVKYGELILFTLSSASLLYIFRKDHAVKDSMLSVLRYLVGSSEQAKDPERLFEESPPIPESPDVEREPEVREECARKDLSACRPLCNLLTLYKRLVKLLKDQKRSAWCPHQHSCLYYILHGLGKMLVVGYGVQVTLRLVLSLGKIVRRPSIVPRLLFSDKVLSLGAFIGLFSGIFRGASCALRWIRKCDSENHAIPAGLLAGTSFSFYPNNTVALYVFWKALQIFYNKLVDAGRLPDISFGMPFLYAFSTAILFHAGLLEPHNLRPSYYKFLYGLSGGRIAAMDRLPLDKFLLETSKHHDRVVKAMRLDPRPTYNFRLFGNPYPTL